MYKRQVYILPVGVGCILVQFGVLCVVCHIWSNQLDMIVLSWKKCSFSFSDPLMGLVIKRKFS